MDAYNAIVGKRDQRDYDSRPIAPDSLRRILQAGRMAGSSGNRQRCRLVVLNDRSILEAMAAAGSGTAPMLSAPLTIAIVLPQPGSSFDVGRVAQNMMVAAWAEGITSCPQNMNEQEPARAALGLPDDYGVGMCVAFGYPAADAPARESRQRLPVDELVHWGRW